eukprot:TRINITY_DN20696_c0_g1_i2.p1 TRINITY_DN20696_c0_g1~~TRINITY_DN20696_c0_g1_i2.p1  ORF type:complete len:286 (-),score=34.12 TRINITY_DN20696_c0_g1_i2:278-1135(-)
MRGSGEDENTRHFWVQMLTEKFVVCESSKATIRDLKRRIQDIKSVEGAVCLVHEGSDKDLPNNMKLDEFTDETTLLCVIRGAEVFESQLCSFRSPGDPMQKYLRWLQGIPAGDERVLQSLWFVSLLANVEMHCDQESAPDVEVQVDQVTAAAFLGLDANAIWQTKAGEMGRVDDVEVLALSRRAKITPALGEQLTSLGCLGIRRALEPHYKLADHIHVLEWILREGEKALRVIMAEVYQISCRGIDTFLGIEKDRPGPSHPRQMESYKHLLAIVKCDDEQVRFWA